MSEAAHVFTDLLVDGENIDATLGNSVLVGRRPNPGERPRWDQMRDFAQREWSQPVRGLFFLNATSGQLRVSFVQALLALDYRPIPLADNGNENVVDIGIQRTLEALEGRAGEVLLAVHDGDFVPQTPRLLGDGRRVGVLDFREYVSTGLAEVSASGTFVFDLEDDVRGFNEVLPRVRIIPIAKFDPLRYL